MFEDVSLLVRAVRLVIVAVGPQHARQVGSTLVSMEFLALPLDRNGVPFVGVASVR